MNKTLFLIAFVSGFASASEPVDPELRQEIEALVGLPMYLEIRAVPEKCALVRHNASDDEFLVCSVKGELVLRAVEGE